GKSTQDLLFRLNWEVANPHGPAPTGSDRVGTNLAHTTNAHVLFEVGIVNQPEGVNATSVGDLSSSSLQTSLPTPALASMRKATFGGELDYNLVLAPDSGNTFVELGGVVKGNLDASVEGANSTQDVGSSVLLLTRNGTGTGSFRGEAAARFSLKQYRD